MMEVGSSAGYYTSKSPQMILHEWCRRQGRPKPRYKALPTEDGRFRCRVGILMLLCGGGRSAFKYWGIMIGVCEVPSHGRSVCVTGPSGQKAAALAATYMLMHLGGRVARELMKGMESDDHIMFFIHAYGTAVAGQNLDAGCGQTRC